MPALLVPHEVCRFPISDVPGVATASTPGAEGP